MNNATTKPPIDFDGNKILLVQGREYAGRFGDFLASKGIAYEKKEEVAGDVMTDITSYTYTSATFGHCVAYEIVLQYSCDGFWQLIVTADSPIADITVKKLQAIEHAWNQRDMDQSYTINVWLSEPHYAFQPPNMRRWCKQRTDAERIVNEYLAQYKAGCPNMLVAVVAPDCDQGGNWHIGGDGWSRIDLATFDVFNKGSSL